MQIGLLVTAKKSGDVSTGLVHSEEGFRLKEMCEHVGCETIDMASLTEDIDIWVDDNGLFQPGNIVLKYKLKSKPENPLYLAGNALFLSSNEKGESIGLNAKQLKWIKEEVIIHPYAITKED